MDASGARTKNGQKDHDREFSKLKFCSSGLNEEKKVKIMGCNPPRSNLDRVSNSDNRDVSSFSEAMMFSTYFIHVGILPLVSYSTLVYFSKRLHIIAVCPRIHNL